MRAFHPAANIFPLLEGEEFRALVEDIRANGLREPIRVESGTGLIIDGRNRYRACLEAEVEPAYWRWEGGDPVSYVLSLNLHRRHLNESQRAMIAARIANGTRGGDRSKVQICTLPDVTQKQAAAMLNVGERSVKHAKKVLDFAPVETIAAVERGELPVSQVTRKLDRADRVQEIAESVAEPSPLEELPQRYPVIYADPPWAYDFSKDSADEIEEHYPTMSLDAICDMPVGDICTRDAVLFLWTTSPKLKEAMRVIDSWGFTYRTCAVWDKEHIGMGYYFRQRHELLLVATRGSLPVPEGPNRPPSVYSERRTEHSRKPAAFAEMIETMYPELPKIELFCREPREGWAVWGNQVPSTTLTSD